MAWSSENEAYSKILDFLHRLNSVTELGVLMRRELLVKRKQWEMELIWL